jgi:hypothetical protein
MKLIVASSTIVGPSVPAKRGSTNKWKLLDDLVSDADWLVERYDALAEQEQELLRHAKMIERHEMPDIMTDPALDADEIETLEKCRRAIVLLDPDDNYDDEGNFKKSIIAKRLTAMIGAYPSGAPATPEVYIKMLLEHVAAIDELNYLMLESACREIERNQKFLPAVSEVLKIITEQQEVWEKRQAAIGAIERRARDVAGVLAKVRPKIEAALAERVKKEAAIALTEATLELATAKKMAIQRQEDAAETARILEHGFQRLAAAETRVAEAEIALAKAKERAAS